VVAIVLDVALELGAADERVVDVGCFAVVDDALAGGTLCCTPMLNA
jgi:hypothetical protein